MSEIIHDTVDSLVEKCIGVFSEIILFGQSLERKISSSYGFDGHYTLNERLEMLTRNTRSGKQLSKSSILLVHGVIEALLTHGRMQEKDLKEYLVAKFKQLGLKVSNRSVFGGTSLEVGSVCNVLGAIGLLETFTNETEDENGQFFNSNSPAPEVVQLDPSLREALTQLNNALRIKFENTPFEAANKSDTATSSSIFPPSASTAIVPSQNETQIDELPDGGLFDALLTDQCDATHLVSDPALAVDVISQNTNNFGVNSSVSTKKSSQSHTARKFWRIRNTPSIAGDTSGTNETALKQQTNSLKLLQLIANASSTLFQWMQSAHSLATHCDVEEKLLRHTCYNLGVSLPRQSMRDSVRQGTAYLAPMNHRGSNGGNKRSCVYGDSHNAGHSSQERDMSSSTQSSFSRNDQLFSNRCKRDLFDNEVRFTGSMLIDKVGRSRRQRVSTNSGNANMFHAEGLHKLKSVTRKTLQFWQQQHAQNEEETARGKKHRASDGASGGGFHNSAVSFAEYLYASQQNTTFNNQQVNAAANNNASLVFNNAVLSHALLAGTHPSVSSATIRRYAPTHPLFYYEGVDNVLPDISIATQPVPWKSLANEFSLVQLDETGEFVDGLSQQMLSQVARSLSTGNFGGLVNTSHSESGNPPVTEQPHTTSNPLSSRKRNRSISQFPTNQNEEVDQNNAHNATAMNPVLKRKVISEVLAPQVKLTTLSATEPSSSLSASASTNAISGDEDEEDTSDEHYLARHDAVLRSMREKWALLNRLKHDVRRDISNNVNLVGQPQQKRQRSASCEDLPSSLSLLSPTESAQNGSQEEFLHGDMPAALTPLTKKRGRPPKFHRNVSCKGTPAAET